MDGAAEGVHHGAAGSTATERDTPRRMRRSDIHEQDISRILVQMRLRDRTPRMPRSVDAKYSDPGPRRTPVPPTPSESDGLFDLQTFDPHFTSPEALTSPSVTALSRRSASARSREPVPDIGEEYMRPPSRAHPRQSLQRIISRERAPSTPRLARSQSIAHEPSMSAHIRNLQQALDLFRQNSMLQETDNDVLPCMEESVELAVSLNGGLRQAIHRVLDVQMASALNMRQESVDSLDSELSELLKYSDDHVRRLTDTLIALTRRRNASARKSATPQLRSLSRTSIPKSSTRTHDFRYDDAPMSAREFAGVPETPTHRGALRAREALSALRSEATNMANTNYEAYSSVGSVSERDASIRRSNSVTDIAPVRSRAVGDSLSWFGAMHRPVHASAPLAQLPLGQRPNSFDEAAAELADNSVDVD